MLKRTLTGVSALLLSATALASPGGPAKSAWPTSFTTPQVRLDFAPGAYTVTVDSSANVGGAGRDFRDLELSGSPNLDPLNGLPWQAMASFDFQLGWANDAHHDTAEQCASMAEQVSLLPASSPHRFRIEITMGGTGTVTIDTGAVVAVSTRDLSHLTCTIL
jgi:hypothetical protein